MTPFIWFKGQAEAAINFYSTVFPDSKVLQIERYSGDQGIPNETELKGKVLTARFTVAGQDFMALDGGPQPGFELTSAVSFMVLIDTQEELDRVWDKLLDGGQTMQCGWIKDKFGVTWQIVPQVMADMMADPDATDKQKKALMAAMMPMVKLDGNKLKEAFDSGQE